ncbi:MAG: NPCBM/NEW2 domain-containing protein [Acidimicrobiales bacterium]
MERYQYVIAAVASFAAVAGVVVSAVRSDNSSADAPDGATITTTIQAPTSQAPSRVDGDTSSSTTAVLTAAGGTKLGRDLPPRSTEACRTPASANGSAWQLGAVQVGPVLHDNAYACNLFSGGVGSLDFILGSSFRKFTVTIGLAEDSTSQRHRVKFEIIGDGVHYLAQTKTLGFGERVDIEANVSGVSRLRLQVTAEGTPGGSDAPSRPVWASPVLNG